MPGPDVRARSRGGSPIDSPIVSIGLPTLDGERYLARALESLLAQDHADLEIVVSDNASSDRTPDIVREFRERDPRVRLERLDRRVSAAQNFNRVFARTSGPFFMWAADDDLWAPSYVSRCLAALEARPDAVMASTGLRFIDPDGAVMEADYARYDNPDLSSPSQVERVRRLLRRGGWYQVYGLARRDALARTRLFQDVYGPDVVLVLELALLGPILRIPDPLFWYRRYPGRTEHARVARQGGIPDAARVAHSKATHLEEALVGAVGASSLPRTMKLRLTAEVLRAAYLDVTPLSSRTRNETRERARRAVHDRDPVRVVKFCLAYGLPRARAIGAAGRRKARRVSGAFRRRLGRGAR